MNQEYGGTVLKSKLNRNYVFSRKTFSSSYKFQQPQKNHFSVDRPVSIHKITNNHNQERKSGL